MAIQSDLSWAEMTVVGRVGRWEWSKADPLAGLMAAYSADSMAHSRVDPLAASWVMSTAATMVAQMGLK